MYPTQLAIAVPYAAPLRCIVMTAGRDRLEQRPQWLDYPGLPADHQAVAAVETPDATAYADIEIVDALLAEGGGARDVVAVVGVATIDDHVAGIHLPAKAAHGLISDPPGRYITQTARGLSSLSTSCSREVVAIPPRPGVRRPGPS